MRFTQLILLLALCCVCHSEEPKPYSLTSGIYDFEFTMERLNQVELACKLDVRPDGSLVLAAGKRDPLPGTIKGQKVDFLIKNDANHMALSGKLHADNYIKGALAYFVDGEKISGTFRIYVTGQDPEKIQKP